MIHTKTKIRVRYAETDMMGLVHHQNYVAFFEQARVEMLSEMGVPYRQLESEGYFLPVLGINIEYLKPNTFDDEIEVHCFLDEMIRVKIKIRYEVYRDGLLTTKGHSLHGFMDGNGRPCRPPVSLLNAARPYFENKKEE